MRPVPLSELAEAVVKPGFERHLTPLLGYRGNLSLGRAHRLWNLVTSGMLHEATVADITQRLSMNPDYSQLCGPERPIQSMGLSGFLSRLSHNPAVMAEMPGMADYVRSLEFWRLSLTPVSQITGRRRNSGAGGWRTFVTPPRKPAAKHKRRELAAPVIVYPFLIHDGGKPEHDLLKRVNAAVPKWLPPDRRADICQDLIVGILCGDIDENTLALPVKEMTKQVLKQFPTKYGDLSLDAEIGEDGFTLMDVLSTEDSIWNRI